MWKSVFGGGKKETQATQPPPQPPRKMISASQTSSETNHVPPKPTSSPSSLFGGMSIQTHTNGGGATEDAGKLFSGMTPGSPLRSSSSADKPSGFGFIGGADNTVASDGGEDDSGFGFMGVDEVGETSMGMEMDGLEMDGMGMEMGMEMDMGIEGDIGMDMSADLGIKTVVSSSSSTEASTPSTTKSLHLNSKRSTGKKRVKQSIVSDSMLYKEGAKNEPLKLNIRKGAKKKKKKTAKRPWENNSSSTSTTSAVSSSSSTKVISAGGTGGDGEGSDGKSMGGLLSGLTVHDTSSAKEENVSKISKGNVDSLSPDLRQLVEEGALSLEQALSMCNTSESSPVELGSSSRGKDCDNDDGDASVAKEEEEIKETLETTPSVDVTQSLSSNAGMFDGMGIARQNSISSLDGFDDEAAAEAREVIRRKEAAAEAERKRLDAEAEADARRLEREREAALSAARAAALRPSARLKALVDGFKRRTMRLGEAIDDVIKEEKTLSVRRTECSSIITNAEKGLREAEEEQYRASEAEDFERAEELNDVIATYREEKVNALNNAEALLVSLQKSRDKKLQLFQENQECVANIVRALDEFCAESDLKLEKLEEKASQEAAAEKAALEVTIERQRMSEEQFANHEKQLAEDREQTNATIAAQVDKYTVECENSEEAAAELEIEIEELRKKLGEKEALLAEHKNTISRAVAKIAEVKENFAPALLRLEKKTLELEQERVEVEGGRTAIEEKEVALSKQRERIDEEGKEMNVALKEAKRAHDASLMLRDATESLQRYGSDWATKSKEQASSVEALRIASSEAKKKIDELHGERLSLETKAVAAQQAIAECKLRLPSLEEKKKLLAKQRQFREAGTVAKEIKALLAQKEKAEEEATTAEQAIKEFANVIETAEAKVLSTERDLASAMREMDMEKVRMLQLDVKRLGRNVRKIEKRIFRNESNNLDMENFVLMQLKKEFESSNVELNALASELDIEIEPLHVDEEEEEEEEVEEFGDDSNKVTEDSNEKEIRQDKGKYDDTHHQAAIRVQALARGNYSRRSTTAVSASSAVTTNDDDSNYSTLSMKQLASLVASLQDKVESLVECEDFDGAATAEAELEKVKKEGERLSKEFSEAKARKEELNLEIDRLVADEDYDGAAEVEEELQVINDILTQLAPRCDGVEEDEFEDVPSNAKEDVNNYDSNAYDSAVRLQARARGFICRSRLENNISSPPASTSFDFMNKMEGDKNFEKNGEVDEMNMDMGLGDSMEMDMGLGASE
eukprot:g4240.t1